MIIIHSIHDRFHECLRQEAKANNIEAYDAYDDETCLDLARKHGEAIVVVDAHSCRPYYDCQSLMVVKKLKDAKLPNRALMLSWVNREFVLQQTSQNTDNNPCMNIYYQDIGQYIFKELPIKRAELLSIINTSDNA